ncbi:MAG: M48 family metalloprotease [Pseudomonadota bacterium]
MPRIDVQSNDGQSNQVLTRLMEPTSATRGDAGARPSDGSIRHLRRSLRSLAGAALLILGTEALGASADPIELPVLGDASSSLISPQLEREIGRDFLKQINASLPTVRDPLLKYYTDRHMSRLAQHSQLKDKLLSTTLIDSDQINAFAAPGGVVGVNLGLMLYAEDVHEYSGVLAHELAHLSQRHFARGVEEQRQQALPNLAAMLAAIAIGAMGGGEAGIAALSSSQAAAQSNALRYSRTREQEADRVGLNTLVAAGMDPHAMGRMFERMQRAYRFSRKPPEFLLTHPLSDTRVADARAQAARYPKIAYADALDYQMMKVRAELHYTPSPAAGVQRFRKAVKDNPDNEVANYGLALALSRAGEHKEALILGDTFYTAHPDSLLHVGSYAQLLTDAGELDQALRLLSHQLVLNPDNAPMSMLYATALAKAGEHQQAQAVLTRQSRLRPNDVDVWYDLAETAGLAGDIVAVHRARAEFFALHGSYQKAIQHLQYARRLVNRTDDELLSELDQKIIDLRTALRELRS